MTRRKTILSNIILYSTGCPKCNILKKKLTLKGIQFEENNDVELMLSKGFQQAPILEVNGKVMSFSDANNWLNSQQEEAK